jgi:hypothetical protein
MLVWYWEGSPQRIELWHWCAFLNAKEYIGIRSLPVFKILSCVPFTNLDKRSRNSSEGKGIHAEGKNHFSFRILGKIFSLIFSNLFLSISEVKMEKLGNRRPSFIFMDQLMVLR